MNYPFLYQRLDLLNLEELKKGLVKQDEKYEVWEDWHLQVVRSEMVESFLKTRYSHLKIHNDRIFISRGVTSNFHIDRFHYHHLMHRILIPLENNFQYEWIVEGQSRLYRPLAGEVLMFNNMLPHRFKADEGQTLPREVIYLDLYDPKIEAYIARMTATYSAENEALDRKHK